MPMATTWAVPPTEAQAVPMAAVLSTHATRAPQLLPSCRPWRTRPSTRTSARILSTPLVTRRPIRPRRSTCPPSRRQMAPRTTAMPDGPKSTDCHPLSYSFATLRQTGMHPKPLRSFIESRRPAGLHPISYAAILFFSRPGMQDCDTTILRSYS
jgi:hypothetical protein